MVVVTEFSITDNYLIRHLFSNITLYYTSYLINLFTFSILYILSLLPWLLLIIFSGMFNLEFHCLTPRETAHLGKGACHQAW